MKHIKMIIQYDGTRYKGWQVQGNTKDTIQGKLQDVLSKIVDEPIEIRGAGRTDAGVHAHGQVADFFVKETIDMVQLQKDLEHYLPEDIRILSLEEVPQRFHSRLSATHKTYVYRIWKGEKADVFQRKFVECMAETLDVNQMQKAALYLVGEHDFMAYCGNRKMKKSTIRTIYDINIEETANEIIVELTGDGFLQNMVRIIVGTLIEVGKGMRKSDEIPSILESKQRSNAGYTISPKGLFLKCVYYDGNCNKE